MSGLLKSDALLERTGDGIRPFERRPTVPTPTAPSREEVLQARIAELEADLEALAAESRERLEEAIERAAAEALLTRSDAESKALAALQESLTAAQEDWKERLAAWEGTAAGIARAALEQVFGPDAASKSAITAAIARQLHRLESGAVIKVRVCPGDFTDATALEQVSAALGPGLRIALDPDLKAGSCVLDLVLGHLDCGPGTQWKRIDDLLDRLERESAAA